MLLIKPIETDEHWGPLVLLEETRQRWTGAQCEVVAVGVWERCEDEDCERPEEAHSVPDHGHICRVAEGDWLLCRPRCFVATDVENVWVCKQSDVLAKLVLTP